MKPRVFISHSSTDTWIAKQIADHARDCGANTFLDNTDIEHGDDFEEKILAAADSSTELLVLLTPWSMTRPYIWLEIGAFWGRRQRIVGVLIGLDAADVASDDRMPVALKRLDLLVLNDIDSYFSQLRVRVAQSETENDGV